MKENNKSVIIVLIVITIIMGIITILALNGTISLNQKRTDNTEEITDNTQNNTPVYNYSNIKGLYTFTGNEITDENNNKFTPTYYLYLYENGTFNYKLSMGAPFGYMGNYIIIDNKIILNYLFSTNSGAGINVTEGTHTININDDNTLIDTNQPIDTINLTSVTLEKATLEDENTFLNGNDFSNILNNYHISNNIPNTQ